MTPQTLSVIDLGRTAYDAALTTQRATHARVVAGAEPETVFLVEHDPVVTVSRRRGAAENLLASSERLAKLGIEGSVRAETLGVAEHLRLCAEFEV